MLINNKIRFIDSDYSELFVVENGETIKIHHPSKRIYYPWEENIVLKEEDYLNYSENFKLTETLLKSIFSTKSLYKVSILSISIFSPE